ncbi:PepSY domain-containing protein [Mucilaginibacter calamicampi]|uniref:PepSY domain-containing protein n=1 Tax=Mucilaginibacter calamicampi TaxID=1302352 RepID=A0ABW2YTB6_9SPHI
MKKSTANNQAAKRRFYKWHRIIGLTALTPIIGWTISGLSHPLMSNWLRPAIPKEVFAPATQDKIAPAVTLQQVLAMHNIQQVRNFSLIKFNKGAYYQILDKDSVSNYYSVADGSFLPHGDKAYAEYLARYFTQDSISAIKQMTFQNTFDSHYQPINRLLPVWKVTFDRPDGMDVYVETAQSRMGTFNNNTRKFFLVLFEQMHTWNFLADIGGEQLRIIVLMVAVSSIFLAMLSGLIVYGLFWKKFKEVTQKKKNNSRDDKRIIHRYHRQLGLIMSALMLTFTVSGGFHLYITLHNYSEKSNNYQQLINVQDLKVSNLDLPIADSSILRVGLAKFNDKTYYQVLTNKKQVRYIDATNNEELQDGDAVYARYLAAYYRNFRHGGNTESGQLSNAVTVTPVKQFTNDYGFINKRLPVEQVSYDSGDDWYIETTSAKLATKVTGIDRAEGLTFIFLHKFFWMTWAGKDIRDIVSMLAALGILIVSLLGLTAFIKNK